MESIATRHADTAVIKIVNYFTALISNSLVQEHSYYITSQYYKTTPKVSNDFLFVYRAFDKNSISMSLIFDNICYNKKCSLME